MRAFALIIAALFAAPSLAAEPRARCAACSLLPAGATGSDLTVATLRTTAGSNAMVAIGPSGDDNTGFWFPAADSINITTAGSLRWQITSTGFLLPGSASLDIASAGTRVGNFYASVGNFSSSVTLPGAASIVASGNGFAAQFACGNSSGDECGITNSIGASAATSTQAAFKFYHANGALGSNDLILDIGDNAVSKFTVDAEGDALSAGSTSASTFIWAKQQYLNTANGTMFVHGTTPTISSGFGTSPSIVGANGTVAFEVNVGTGGTATSGVIGLSTAATGWNCQCTDITTASATVFLTKQTASSTTTCTVGNFNTAGAAAAWVASDKLRCIAMAY